MILEAAVEAAAKATYEVMPVELFGRDQPVTWDELSDSTLGQRRKQHELARARAALEAGAPHMLAAAWDDGWDAHEKHEDAITHGTDYPAPNPYRPAP